MQTIKNDLRSRDKNVHEIKYDNYLITLLEFSNTIKLFFYTAVSILVISNQNRLV